MTTKEWLNRGYNLDAEIRKLEEAKRRMLDTITNITTKYGGQVVSGTTDPHKFDRYAEYCDGIDERIKELIGIKTEIQETISECADATDRAVLIGRYVNFDKWEQIAVDMNYTCRGVYKIHDHALKSAEKILKKKGVVQ